MSCPTGCGGSKSIRSRVKEASNKKYAIYENTTLIRSFTVKADAERYAAKKASYRVYEISRA